MSFLSDYTEKNSNLIPQIDIPCFAWNSQAEQGFLFFKAKSLLEERLEKRKAEKKETEERLEKQRAEKQEQEERQYNLKIDGKDVDDLTGKMVELLGTSTSIGVTENGVSAFDALA